MELTLARLLGIPGVRAALRQNELTVEEDLQKSRRAALADLRAIESPIAKAKQAAENARADFEVARKGMEVARGKLGNADQRLRETRAKESEIRKQLQALGEAEVDLATRRIGSLITYLESQLQRLNDMKADPNPILEERRQVAIATRLQEIKLARKAMSEVNRLSLSDTSPVELASRCLELMAEAGLVADGATQ